MTDFDIDGGYAPHVDVEVDGEVAIATLINPARRNAISLGMWRELEAFAIDANGDPDVRAVLFRGADGTFCAGADISDFDEARDGSDASRAYDDQLERTCLAVEAIRQPTVAQLEGPVVGAGAALAACCDLRVAAADAFVMVPAARLGLGYDPRGVARLARTFGEPTAAWLLLTAGRLPAARAFASGAVHEVAEEVDEAIERLTARLAENAPLTMAAAKVALRAVRDGTEPTLMDEAWRMADLADASDDYAEGRAAFSQKRPPRFMGK
ncbi:MAG: enoyl-CoA hydratase-related protein [Pseudomonadota bacterium]